MKLSKEFLDDYKRQPDPFKTLLSRFVYRSKYQRKEDRDWVDTITRVVHGNIDKDPNVTRFEAEYLFDTLFHMYGTPAGRGLFSGGTNMPGDARYNCSVISINNFDSWGWVLLHSMLGVGVGTTYHEIDKLPKVAESDRVLTITCNPNHPDFDECEFNKHIGSATNYAIEDSREGWRLGLYYVVRSAFEGKSCTLDVSNIRRRGAPISTFQGTVFGFAPLVALYRAAWAIIRARAGKKLRVIDCSDITNLTGVCAVMGNIRRTALNTIFPWNEESLDAKIDLTPEQSYRYTSNNSLALYTKQDVDFFVKNSREIARRVVNLGEPGIANIYECRKDDPNVIGLNPCFEATLEDREFCCLAELVLPNLLKQPDAEKRIRVMTRFLLRERMNKHSCSIAEAIRIKNMRIGMGVTGVTDVSNVNYKWIKNVVVTEGSSYARALGVSVPVKFTVVKPSGTISKLVNCAPGEHSPWSPYYIQRARVGINEPIAFSLIEANVPWEFAETDKTNRTLCFEFPIAANATSYATRESVRDQLDRQLMLQTDYADQAVSATISFPSSDIDELASLMSEYVPKLKCVSFFPNNGGKYKQAPYEEITKTEYELRMSMIKNDHPLVYNDDGVEIEECKTGACLVR